MDQADEAVPFRLVATGGGSLHRRLEFRVIRSLQDWQAHREALHRYSGPGSSPEPDLTGNMLVEVAVGQTPTGSCRVEITGLVLSDGVLKVQATLHLPKGDSRAVGSPYAVVETPAFDGPLTLDLCVTRALDPDRNRAP